MGFAKRFEQLVGGVVPQPKGGSPYGCGCTLSAAVMIAVVVMLLIALGCTHAPTLGPRCLDPLFGARQCLVQAPDRCTWITCDVDGCLEQGSWEGECSPEAWWSPSGPLPPIRGEMQRGCLWIWDLDGEGRTLTRFDPQTCYPRGDAK